MLVFCKFQFQCRPPLPIKISQVFSSKSFVFYSCNCSISCLGADSCGPPLFCVGTGCMNDNLTSNPNQKEECIEGGPNSCCLVDTCLCGIFSDQLQECIPSISSKRLSTSGTTASSSSSEQQRSSSGTSTGPAAP